MAYNAQNTLPGAHGTGLAEDANESGRTHGLAQPTGLGLGQTQPHGAMKGGLTGSAGEARDGPGVYNSANAVKTVHHMNDDRRERSYDNVQIEETVVHHDVERVKPVLHQEVHQTRLHEVTHHKVEPVRDLGVVEVVHHRDTDACGNLITSDLNAIRGVNHGGVAGMVENIKDKVTGHHNTHAVDNSAYGSTPTTGYNTTHNTTDYNTTNTKPGIVETIKDKITGQPTHATDTTGSAYGSTPTTGYNTTHNTTDYNTSNTKPGIVETIKDKITDQPTHPTTGTTGYKTDTVLVPADPPVVTQTTDPVLPHTHNTTTTTDHHSHGTTTAVGTEHKVGGIKGLINKVIPGPGPF